MGALYQEPGQLMPRCSSSTGHIGHTIGPTVWTMTEVLKRIYFLSVLAPELEAADTYGPLLSRNLKAPGRKELRQARTDGEQAEEVRGLRTLMKRDMPYRMEGAARIVGRWKSEYRKMV